MLKNKQARRSIADGAGVRLPRRQDLGALGSDASSEGDGSAIWYECDFALSARGDFRFIVNEGSVKALVFRKFLRRLMASAKQHIIMVVDGHQVHRAKLIKDSVEQQQGKLKLVYLPPYSQQLNPDEQV